MAETKPFGVLTSKRMNYKRSFASEVHSSSIPQQIAPSARGKPFGVLTSRRMNYKRSFASEVRSSSIPRQIAPSARGFPAARGNEMFVSLSQV
jgi:hypothetical protein